jgi:hypothetical protein
VSSPVTPDQTSEPVLIAHAVTVILAAVVSLGWVAIPNDTIDLVGTGVALLVSTVVAVVARGKVTPVAKAGTLDAARCACWSLRSSVPSWRRSPPTAAATDTLRPLRRSPARPQRPLRQPRPTSGWIGWGGPVSANYTPHTWVDGSLATPLDAARLNELEAGVVAVDNAQAARQPALAPTAVKTTAYTAAVGDLVPVDLSSANVTVTLPSAPADKAQVAVKVVTPAAARRSPCPRPAPTSSIRRPGRSR